MHFDLVSSSLIQGLMNIQINSKIPIVDAVLSCYDLDQVSARISPDSELAKSYALTCIKMSSLKLYF